MSRMKPTHLNLQSGYMGRAWEPREVLRDARQALEGVEYDTLVGTGLSGAIVVPALARSLRKRALIVRKPKDGSHSWMPAEGTLGKRWVFVDDFIDTGETRQRVRDTIDNLVRTQTKSTYYPIEFATEYVGDFLYNTGRFTPARTQTENEHYPITDFMYTRKDDGDGTA